MSPTTKKIKKQDKLTITRWIRVIKEIDKMIIDESSTPIVFVTR